MSLKIFHCVQIDIGVVFFSPSPPQFTFHFTLPVLIVLYFRYMKCINYRNQVSENPIFDLQDETNVGVGTIYFICYRILHLNVTLY